MAFETAAGLKPAQVEESWPSGRGSKGKASQEAPADAQEARGRPSVEDYEERAWHEGDEAEEHQTPPEQEPAEEAQEQAETTETPDEEIASEDIEAETPAEAKKRRRLEDLDFTKPEEVKEFVERKEKRRQKEIARLSRKNFQLKEAIEAQTRTQREAVELQKVQLQRQIEFDKAREERQRQEELYNEYLRTGTPPELAAELTRQTFARMRPAVPDEREQRLMRIEHELNERRANEMVQNYVSSARATLRSSLKNYNVSDEQFEAVLETALDVAAAKQIIDPKEAVARALRPVLPALQTKKSAVQRRPTGKTAEVHRMTAQSGRTGSQKAGASVSGAKAKKDVEALEREWGEKEPW